MKNCNMHLFCHTLNHHKTYLKHGKKEAIFTGYYSTF